VTELNQPPQPMECYPFSALLITLPPAISQVLRAVAQKIPDEQLMPQGREIYPHVTVLDGLHADTVGAWRAEVEQERPFVLQLGKTSAFLAEQTGGTHDVLKVDIHSDALERLHRRLAARLPHTRAFSDFVPHATIAFLQPGFGARYANQKWLEGWSVLVDRLTFSSRTFQQEEIRLRGQRRALAAGGRGPVSAYLAA
jgi:2'-5' RNA ligase